MILARWEFQDRFFHYAKLSLWIHTCLILFVIILGYLRGFFFESRKRENILLVNSSVRVDVVAMPRMTIKELKAVGAEVSMNHGKDILAKDVPAPEKSKDKGAEFAVKKKKKIDFRSLLKKYSKDRRVSKKRSKSKQNGLKELVVAGNRLSKGTALVGGGGEALAGELANYMSRLPDKVRPNWNLPSYLGEKELRCRVRVFISASGHLVKAEIFESSGDEEYDRRAMAAVRSSDPFAPPPESVRTRAIRGDIILGFPL